MRKLYKGEKRSVGMEAVRTEGGAFTVATALYEIRSPAGTVVESGAASINTPEFYFIFNTTSEYIEEDNTYDVFFTITITGISKVIMGKVSVYVSGGD